MEHRDASRIALGIQQPWVELILRGVKLIEIRSRPTRRRGTIYLYASQRDSRLACAQLHLQTLELDPEVLTRGRIVGSVDLWNCRLAEPRDVAAAGVPEELLRGKFAWELRNPQRFAQPLSVNFLPYGVWFYPWHRKNRLPEND